MPLRLRLVRLMILSVRLVSEALSGGAAFAPPSALPGISPTRGEIGLQDRPA